MPSWRSFGSVDMGVPGSLQLGCYLWKREAAELTIQGPSQGSRNERISGRACNVHPRGVHNGHRIYLRMHRIVARAWEVDKEFGAGLMNNSNPPSSPIYGCPMCAEIVSVRENIVMCAKKIVTPEKYSVRENNFRAPKKLIGSPKTLLECRDAVIMKWDSSRNCSRSFKYIACLAWLALTGAPVSGRAQPLIRRQNDGWEALGSGVTDPVQTGHDRVRPNTVTKCQIDRAACAVVANIEGTDSFCSSSARAAAHLLCPSKSSSIEL
ncbi:hypothetical protein BDZ97DRAFT_1753975 [Flammula alnicola]|nr:hypothetical protein BDZ97DRAFT_1753975 [Flammula alnicola]